MNCPQLQCIILICHLAEKLQKVLHPTFSLTPAKANALEVLVQCSSQILGRGCLKTLDSSSLLYDLKHDRVLEFLVEPSFSIARQWLLDRRMRACLVTRVLDEMILERQLVHELIFAKAAFQGIGFIIMFGQQKPVSGSSSECYFLLDDSGTMDGWEWSICAVGRMLYEVILKLRFDRELVVASSASEREPFA
jgi:hypothetical protein